LKWLKPQASRQNSVLSGRLSFLKPAACIKKLFSKILSLVGYEEGDILCPHCGSKEVEQRWSVFSVITSKKSA